jgi:hypothetical protein
MDTSLEEMMLLRGGGHGPAQERPAVAYEPGGGKGGQKGKK